MNFVPVAPTPRQDEAQVTRRSQGYVTGGVFWTQHQSLHPEYILSAKHFVDPCGTNAVLTRTIAIPDTLVYDNKQHCYLFIFVFVVFLFSETM